MVIKKHGDKELDLNALRLFVAVAEASSFSAAARKLDIPKWTISRGVSGLEATLGIPLLHRTTRSVTLSQAGTALYERVAPLISSIKRAASELPESLGEPAGEVSITAPIDISSVFLGDAITQFTARYRAVRINLFLTSHLDFAIKGFDIALRSGPMWVKDSSMVVKPACDLTGQILASPAYLAGHGTPSELGDLADHEWVVLRDAANIPLDGPDGQVMVKTHGRICSDNLFFLRHAVRSGSGLGVLPTYLTQKDIDSSRLVRVLPQYATQSRLYIVRPQTRQVPRRVRLLINFLCEYLEAHPLTTPIE